MTLDSTPPQMRSLRHTSRSRPTGRTQVTERSVFNSILAPRACSLCLPPQSLPPAQTDPYAQHDVPPGLSERDTAVLRTVKRRAHVLDKNFNLCGVRFGWTFIIGTYPLPYIPHPASSSPLPGSVMHTRTHIFCCATAIIPVVGDALHPVFGYLLVVRPASKAKYVFPVIRVPPFLSITLFITSHSCVSPSLFLSRTPSRPLPSIIYAGFPRHSHDA